MRHCVAAVILSLLGQSLAVGQSRAPQEAGLAPFRPPCVPLVVHDPYFNIWSPADRLSDQTTAHWTTRSALQSMIRIDGVTYRLMGKEPVTVPPFPQTGTWVGPTRTVCDFASPQVSVRVTFTTPLLAENLDVFSRPVTYLTWEIASRDGRSHDVSIYYDNTADLVVEWLEQSVVLDRPHVPGMDVLRMGSHDQGVLASMGDAVRIDWGYFYVATPRSGSTCSAIAPASAARSAFAEQGSVPTDREPQFPRAAKADWPVVAFVFHCPAVGAQPVVKHLLLAYDDLYSILYFRKPLRPFWRRHGAEAADLLRAAERDYARLMRQCQTFDDELTADLERVGGRKYARLAALADRQAMAGGKLVADGRGMPLYVGKENGSAGCAQTVDVMYPQSPLLLLMSPALTEAMLVPVLDYSNSPLWKDQAAPHNLGTYPVVFGQRQGNTRSHMPVEETGNMLLMAAGLAKAKESAVLADRYWPLLTRWADYLCRHGIDPERQLCTDDFMGSLGHNANLSLKSILAIGAFAQLARATGRTDVAVKYRAVAERAAVDWMRKTADGDHSRMAFDQPGTWSQKYNLAWDRVLELGLFPPELAAKEVAFYKQKRQPFGLPLDGRKLLTKLDWVVWSASLAQSREDFQSLVGPEYDFLHATPQRYPMSDIHNVETPDSRGFRCRSVVGAVYLPLLTDEGLWSKWRRRGERISGEWAPLPESPAIEKLQLAENRPVTWRYSFDKPPDGWVAPEFNDKHWKPGTAPFVSRAGKQAGTAWDGKEIWLRREFVLPDDVPRDLWLSLWLRYDSNIYINGVLAARTNKALPHHELLPISRAAQSALKPGKNILAVSARHPDEGYVDVGLVQMGSGTWQPGAGIQPGDKREGKEQR